MIGGIYFAGGYFAGMLGKGGPMAAALAAAAQISVTATAAISPPPAKFEAAATIVITAARANLSVPIDTTAGISIDGIPVTGRVRVAGVTIRDILNDAPNTCSFTIEGDGPAVGQRVRVTMGSHLLFAGAVQTIDQSYDSRPDAIAWDLTAIDDTAEANARRPFGTFFNISATTIAQTMTTSFAPVFSTAGIEAGLPPVTIVFDGSDPFIACLARLATAVGGYCKIEDHVVYLFTEDLEDPPNPLDLQHCFHQQPPLQITTDASQLRTRVYGKGYGESVQADIAAGETKLPIQNGALFPPLGGTAIAGLTPDGAQSERLAFSGVDLGGGGTLVGPGAGPTSAPVVALQGGTGVTTGTHQVAMAYVTGIGKSLRGPAVAITAGTHAPPATAPTAGTATNGTGPDQGSHDYAASFVTAYGETTPSPISNAIATSGAVGQLPAPTSLYMWFTAQKGSGLDTGYHDYKTTLLNATGETEAGAQSSSFLAQATNPVDPYGPSGNGTGTTGGSMVEGFYNYWGTLVTAAGETTVYNYSFQLNVNAGQNAGVIPLPTSTDARVTGRKLYRTLYAGQSVTPDMAVLCATINNNSATSWFDTVAQTAIAGNANPPTVNTTSEPMNQFALTGIATGPAGTTGRRLYRRYQTSGTWKLLTTLNNNTATTYLDNRPNSSLGVDAPASNTTGTAVQQIPLTNIPLGPPGVTSRKLYRRFNSAGTFKLVTTIGNNTTTTYLDAIANSALGAAALGTATALGNQIALLTIPPGAATVTAREIYLTAVGDTVNFRLALTVPDNTTTTGVITMSDATLAGQPLAPIADTSGLQQPQGQVNPGATVLPVASSAVFRTPGGWATLAGGQTVRYTGLSGQTLIGLPASGPGSITTTVLYGSQALPAPMLTGVSGLTRSMLKGSAVHIWLQRDDLQAQAEHAARTGGTGIVEFVIVDTRRGVESLAARCDADLALFARPIVTVAYATRDLKTKSGKPISINLPPPTAFVGTLIIQEVTITDLDKVKGLPPRFTVKASSIRFSLEDTLRRLIAVGPVTVNG